MGTRAKRKEAGAFMSFSEVKKFRTAATTDSPIISQHAVNKTPEKPSNPGALLHFKEREACL